MQEIVSPSVRSPEEIIPLSGPSSLLSDTIKLERHSPADLSCPSSSSPSRNPIPSLNHIPSFTSGRLPSTNIRKKCSAYPYTQPPARVSSGRRETVSAMSAPHYGNWSSNTVKYEQSEFPSEGLPQAQRRSSDSDQQQPYYFASVSDFASIRGSA